MIKNYNYIYNNNIININIHLNLFQIYNNQFLNNLIKNNLKNLIMICNLVELT